MLLADFFIVINGTETNNKTDIANIINRNCVFGILNIESEFENIDIRVLKSKEAMLL